MTVVTAQPAPRSMAEIRSRHGKLPVSAWQALDELKVAAGRRTSRRVRSSKFKAFCTDRYGAVRVDRVAGTVGVVVAIIVVRRTWSRISD